MADRKPEINFTIQKDEVGLSITAPVRIAAEIYKRACRGGESETLDGQGLIDPYVSKGSGGMDQVMVDAQSISRAIEFLKELSDLEALPTDSAIKRLEAYQD